MIKETAVSLHMKQGSMVDSILVPKVTTGELVAVIGAFDKTDLMKCKGYTHIYEDDKFTKNADYILPNPPAKIFRRKMVQFKLTNATGQNIFVKGKFPYNSADTANYQAMADAFKAKTLAFGKVEMATWEIQG